MSKENKIQLISMLNKTDLAFKVFFPLLYLIIGSLVFSKVVDDTSSEWRQFDSAYINYDFSSGHTVHNYAIRKDDGSFLVAADTPEDLNLEFKFSQSEKLNVKVVSSYPDWICKGDAAGKARIEFTSKNINEQFVLKNLGVQEFILEAFKSEPVSVDIRNSSQKDCGRAVIFFQVSPNKHLLVFAFFAFWLVVTLLMLLAGQNQVYTGLAIFIHLIAVNASLGVEAITINSLFWLNGVSIVVLGLLLLVRTSPNIWLRNIFGSLVIAPIVWVFAGLSVYKYEIGKSIDADVIHAVLQTNFIEAWEYLITQFGLSYLIVYLVVIIFLVLILAFSDTRGAIKKSFALGLSFILLGMLLTINGRAESPLLEVVQHSQSSYFFELDQFRSLAKSRENSNSISDLKRVSDEDQVLIVVIGESANRDHLSLYGYGRDTTPYSEQLVNAGEMLRFDFAYSNYTGTNQALSLALTKADQYGDKRWMSAPSILNLANNVGIKTYWISNQQTLGAWDNHVSLIAKEANIFVSKNKLTGKSRDALEKDGVLLEEINEILMGSDGAKLIFVHLQGSHASYCSRFPSEAALFSGINLDKSIFGWLANNKERAHNSVINCYDDSIYYTDFVLSEIINLTKQNSTPTGVLYFSDHSEDVISKKAHSTALFTYDMIEIPFLFWSNKQWRNIKENQWLNLQKNQLKDFTNDHVFETLSGLLGITSPEIQRHHDLSSQEYKEGEPMSLHGRVKIRDSKNKAYWQRKNISKLKSSEDCSRLLPHRVNSIGKARDAIAAGACGLEIDIIIENNSGDYVLQVGHGLDTKSNNTLEQLLSKLDTQDIKKVWLDIKNINNDNIEGLINRLNKLDASYDLKSISLVETSFYDKKTELISQAGYHLSYYLPTQQVLDAGEGGSNASVELASILVSRVSTMAAQNISFDLRLYRFVKEYMEPKLEIQSQNYHSWFPENLSFATPTLLQEIANEDFYIDPKMETILLTYSSPFSI